ncbi:hypothetical protein E2C01_056511 [Portunus trituberculatus]|uniref:Uncharacterized protein n=1 Tax=Portunus trituberculatus TaxID=210409 RepID=A0A5B7GXX7_PORTR|nr:hypothetical protein [Portunus trituberculatus]
MEWQENRRQEVVRASALERGDVVPSIRDEKPSGDSCYFNLCIHAVCFRLCRKANRGEAHSDVGHGKGFAITLVLCVAASVLVSKCV